MDDIGNTDAVIKPQAQDDDMEGVKKVFQLMKVSVTDYIL